MAEIKFLYTPSYEQDESDPTLVEPEIIYSITLPKGVTLSKGLAASDIQYHFNMWLRGLGYHVEE